MNPLPTYRKLSSRVPIIPPSGMGWEMAGRWRKDMAQSLKEVRRPQEDSLLHVYAEISAPYYVDCYGNKAAHKQRKKEQSNPAPHGLSLSSDDFAIRGKAEMLAVRCERACNRLMRDMLDDFTEANGAGDGEAYALNLAGALFDVAEAVVISGGSPAPKIMGEDTQAVMAAVRRTWCAKWWRRRLNTDFKRWKEAKHIAAGRVARGRSAYISKDALDDRRDQLKRNDDLLKAFLAICDDEAVSLKACADASVSNPEMRRNEVMCRIRGIEEWADSVGYVSQFWTLTAPSRFHRFKTTKSGRLIDNPKWNGTTPKDAQAHLVKVWARIRSKLNRDGVSLVGFRVVEPHHDGCPHWHMLVFCSPEFGAMKYAEEVARHYALQDSPGEAGAKKRRFVVEVINRDINKKTGKRNSAVGYIAKYISKNLDGKKGADNEPMGGNSHDGGGTIDENIRKVDAWRSLWGVRQFQFFAAGAVSVWRELRRLRECPAGRLASVWKTAQGELVAGKDARACWCSFLTQLAKNPVEIITARKVGDGQFIEYKNEYGEHVNQIIGLRCSGVSYQTRFKDWSLIEASEAERLGLVSITVRTDGSEEVKRIKKSGGEPPNIKERGK